MHAPQLTTAFYKSVIDPHSPFTRRRIARLFSGRKQSWGNQPCFRPSAGQAGKSVDLPGWVRVLSKLSGWDWATAILEILAARTPCGEPVEALSFSAAPSLFQLSCREKTCWGKCQKLRLLGIFLSSTSGGRAMNDCQFRLTGQIALRGQTA